MSHLPANWLPPEPPPPPHGRNYIVPALITAGCALLLLGGSAFGALSTCGISSKNSSFAFFAFMTMALFVAFVASLVWLFIAVVVAFFRAGKP